MGAVFRVQGRGGAVRVFRDDEVTMAEHERVGVLRRHGGRIAAMAGCAAILVLLAYILFMVEGLPGRGTGSRGPLLPALAAVGTGLWLAFGAAGIGLLLLRYPRVGLGFPLWAAVVGGLAAAALGLVFSGPEGPMPEAGGWPGLLLLGGYAALLLVLGSGLSGAVVLPGESPAAHRAAWVLLAGLPWTVLAHMAVTGWLVEAPTTALLRTAPVPGHVPLAGVVVLVGLCGATLGLRSFRPGWRGTIGEVGLAAAGGLVGYVLLRLAIDPPAAEPGARLLRLDIWLGTYLLAVGVALLGHMAAMLAARAVGYVPYGASGDFPKTGWPEGDGDERTQPARRGRGYGWTALAYAGLVVYGSLVPLELRPLPFETALARFLETPYLTLGVGNRADLVANLLLYIPLGFAAMGWLTGAGTRRGCWVVAPLVAGGCVALAVGVEFAQMYFPPRTVSLNDILAESVGGAIGVGLWLVAGRDLTVWGRRSVRALAQPARLAGYLLTGYVVALAVYELSPFDVVLSADEMRMQLEQGKAVLVPFARASRVAAFIFLAKALLFVPVGYWIVVRWPGLRRRVAVALVGGAVGSLLIELLQLLIFSRYSRATDVVLGAGGALVGGLLATWFGPAARRPLPRGAAWRGAAWLVRLALAGGMVGLLVWGKWRPFEMRVPDEGVLQALAARLHVPFYYQYWNSEFEAAEQLLRDVALPAVLAILLVSLLPRGRGGRVAAAVTAGAVAVVVELGQIVFPPHVPDFTTAVLAVGGVVAGVYLYGPLVRAFVWPPGDDARRGNAV